MRLTQRIAPAVRRIELLVDFEVVVLADLAQGVVFIRIEPVIPALVIR